MELKRADVGDRCTEVLGGQVDLPRTDALIPSPPNDFAPPHRLGEQGMAHSFWQEPRKQGTEWSLASGRRPLQ